MSFAATSWAPAPVQRRHDEDDLQRSVIQYLRACLPGAVVWHTPNGGQRHKKAAQRLKGLGVLAGIPDVCVLWCDRLFMIELKTKRGSASAAQRQLWPQLVTNGAHVMLCRSLPEVETAMREAGVPLRGEVLA